jgi:hypothetical protein
LGDTFQQDVMIERRTDRDNRRVEICRKKRKKKIVGEEKAKEVGVKLFREFRSPSIRNHQRVHNSVDVSVLRYEVFHVGLKEVKVGNTIRRVAGWTRDRRKGDSSSLSL